MNAMAALRASGRASELVVVGYDLMDSTKAGLLDGTLKVVIAHPLRQLAEASDIVTLENEFVDADLLAELAARFGGFQGNEQRPRLMAKSESFVSFFIATVFTKFISSLVLC